MPLYRLQAASTGSANPSYLTNLLPGGAGVQVAGTLVTPGISAPRLEEVIREVYDVTAPTNIGTSGNVPGTPASKGQVLVLDPVNSSQGANWKLSAQYQQTPGGGQYGIVYSPANVGDVGTCQGTANGNISQGARAEVVIGGPTQAYVTTVANTTAISAGMLLCADGAGNLTYAGATPAAGTVLAKSLGPTVATGVSTPVLVNVYVGGF